MLPAVVCVTEGVAPERYPNREQMAEAESKPIQQVSCADLSADTSQVGSAGSPTWVEEIRLVEPDRLGVLLEEVTPVEAAKQIRDSLRQRLEDIEQAGEANAPHVLPRFSGSREKSIWVVAQPTRNGLAHVTFEMLGKARELAQITKSEVAAVLLGAGGDSQVSELAARGADRVMVLDGSGLGPIFGRGVGLSLADAVLQSGPYAVLFASTADGRDLASRLAARLGLGLTGDAIDLEIDEEGRLVQLKPALGGNVIAPILSKTLPNLVTIRPGQLTSAALETGAAASVDTLQAVEFKRQDVRLVREEFQEDQEGLALARAQVVLGIGMGVGERNVPRLQEMARSIGASVAITRDVSHHGWLPQQLQVGISGRTIAPKVYLAVGIRGAFNHTVGLQRAGVIIAVNQNRRATFFRGSSDFGIVGDWEEFLPSLIDEIRPVLLEIT
jgi:electron transfer flavoprotein alpha subunit